MRRENSTAAGRCADGLLGDWLEHELPLLVHDLKSPVAVIGLEMQVLLEREIEGAPGLFHDAALRVLWNVEFISRMVEDLLDSSSFTAGRLELNRSDTDIRGLVHRVVARVVPTPDQSRVTVESATTRCVWLDPVRIERALANLVHNALKYAPDGRIVVRIDALPSTTRVSVTDAGPGVNPGEIAYIFNPYRRAAEARAHEGTGLGLYVSKQMIEAHGGQVGVNSEPGRGSCFYFELPVD